MTTAIKTTKMTAALKALRLNSWVSSNRIKEVTGETDLRSVRRLREQGYNIETRKNGVNYQYKRTNS